MYKKILVFRKSAFGSQKWKNERKNERKNEGCPAHVLTCFSSPVSLQTRIFLPDRQDF